MTAPHGGKLVERVLSGDKKSEALDRARSLPVIRLEDDAVSDVENIATGVYSPLEGFLGPEDLLGVLRHGRLAGDAAWTVPIVLDVDEETAAGLKEGGDVVLALKTGEPLALLRLESKHRFDRGEMALKVYGTADDKHPGVARTLRLKPVLLGGRVDLIQAPDHPYARWHLTPRETRVLFKEKSWRTVVGFQTRNTPHVGHEYVQKTALTFTDGLFINPVIGRKKKGDYKDEVILAAYDELIKNYYLKNRAVMAILKMEMRYAGPKEAIHHAIVRKNFGCTHIIIGRDHAGVGSYYPPYAAQDIFEEFPDLGIAPLFFRSFSHCRKCRSVVNEKTCPHPEADHIPFSGTKIRDMLLRGEIPPVEMMRPEVARIIMDFKEPFNE